MGGIEFKGLRKDGDLYLRKTCFGQANFGVRAYVVV